MLWLQREGRDSLLQDIPAKVWHGSQKLLINFQGSFNQSEYKRENTFKGEKAKVTMALEPKFVRTARLIPLPLVRSGNISDTISQLIGPNEIWFPRTKQLDQEDMTIRDVR